MSRNKELLIVVLDVGPHMHASLEQASKALFTLVEGKLLFKPAHEVAIILYGTSDTNNDLHREQADQGDPDQYTHIVVAKPLQCPDLSYLLTINALPRGQGMSDFVDGMLVATDVFIKATEARSLHKYPKRLVVLSNFEHELRPLEDVIREGLVQQMQDKGIKLEVVCLGEEEEAPSPQIAAFKRANLETLHQLFSEVQHNLKVVSGPVELLGAFKARDVGAFSMYKGPLSVGGEMEIPVRVYKKTTQEKVPSMKPYSDRSRDPDATHEVTLSREYKAPSNMAQEVGPDERVKAYRYGKQTVPLSREDEEALKYQPDKCFQLIGFVDPSRAPRHSYVKDSFIVVPELGGSAEMALSALARGMKNTGKVAVARAVLRARSSVMLVVLTPLLAGPHQPLDCLVMNVLPFADDLRSYFFPPVNHNPEKLPTEEQVRAAQKLVRDMDLGQGQGSSKRRRLIPEDTINPVIQRFYYVLGQRALNPDFNIPERDDLVDLVFDPQPSLMPPRVLDSMQEMGKVFRTTAAPVKEGKDKEEGKEGAPAVNQFAADPNAVFNPDADALGAAVKQVGTANPVQDFEVLMHSGQVGEAIEGLKQVVLILVDTSIGDRQYEKGAACLQALRAASVTREDPDVFNHFLQEVANRYRYHNLHSGFLRLVTKIGLTFITKEESRLSTFTTDQAQGFLSQGQPKSEPSEDQVPALEEEEDEFAGLE